MENNIVMKLVTTIFLEVADVVLVFEVADAGLPVVEVADVGLPVVEVADVGLPVVEVPDVELPVVEEADVGLPVVEEADVGLPVVKEADVGSEDVTDVFPHTFVITLLINVIAPVNATFLPIILASVLYTREA